MATGAELTARWLAAAGVRTVFSLSGNQILPLYEALDRAGIRIVHTRHEAGAVHMADAYARLSGEVGVCLVTAGPGHANALGALAMAEAAESPVLLLSGHAPLSHAGRGAFQEMDQAALARPLTRWAAVASRASDIPPLLAQTFAVAQGSQGGRTGPVHLSLPVDVLTTPAAPAQDDPGHSETVAGQAAVARGLVPRPDDSTEYTAPLQSDAAAVSATAAAAIAQVVSALNAAHRPLILAGPSAARPALHDLVQRFATHTGIPLLILDHPRGLSDPALGRAGQSLPRADAILLFGKRQDYRIAYAQPPLIGPDCRLLQVDPETAEVGRHRPVEIGVVAPLPEAALQLLAAAGALACPEQPTAWMQEVAALRESPLNEPIPEDGHGPLHPLHVFDALAAEIEARGEDRVCIALDGGEFGQWARARLRLQPPHHLVNEPSGAIGFAVPFAIGAKVARPQRTAIAVCGDGAFGFSALELETAARCGLPILVIVGTDGAWGTERHLQTARYGPDRTIATDLTPARYDLLAAGLGGHGESVERAEQLRPALARALAAVERGQPALLNVRIQSVPSPAGGPP